MMSVSVTLSNSSGSYKHVGKISSAVSVKVVGTKPYPDSASAPAAITMAYGEEQQLTINLTPAAVNKIIVWEYDHSAVSITQNPSDPCKFTVKGLKVGVVNAIARVQISESPSATYAVSVSITVTKITLGISVSANTPSKEISIAAAPGTYKCDFVMTPSQVGALSLIGYSVTWRGGETLGAPGITINPATGIISIDRATAVAGGMATFYADVTISDAGLYGNTSFSSTAVDLRIVP
jgi:hypothetical protein